MAGSLAASLAVKGRPANTAVQGDTVLITFGKPPAEATDVQIEIVQEDPGRTVMTFFGDFVGGKYKSKMKSGNLKVSPDHDRPDDINLVFDVNGSTFEAMMLDPKNFVVSHHLRVKVTGIIKGKKQSAPGKNVLHVSYKTVMIVPSGTAKDPALNVLPKWAAQWQTHQPKARSIVTIPVLKPATGKITPKHYDPLIAAVKSAAAKAPNGIIALAIGHGDGGTPPGRRTTDGEQADPWCDLMPEDGKISDTAYLRGLHITLPEINDGEPKPPKPGGVKLTPGGRTIIKLNALDRMADVFKTHPVRMVLLHTCSAGVSDAFIQKISNRLRVFVRAHTEQIEYTGNTTGSILASYVKETPSKVAKHEWPSDHISPEKKPASPPPERFKLPPQ